MKKFTFLVVALMLCGCSQSWYQRRDIKRLDGLAIEQNQEFLKLSNLINPCFSGKAKSDTVTVFGPGDTVFKAGKEVVIRQHDTLKITQHDTLEITKLKINTIHDTVPDNRAIASLQAQYSECSSARDKDDTKLSDALDDAKKADSTSTKRLFIIIGLIVSWAAYIGYRVYKFFAGGAIVDAVKKVI